MTMVFSEFGRRVRVNDSGGTDHGAGGPMMSRGSAVKGGLAGEHPGVDVRPRTATSSSRPTSAPSTRR